MITDNDRYSYQLYAGVLACCGTCMLGYWVAAGSSVYNRGILVAPPASCSRGIASKQFLIVVYLSCILRCYVVQQLCICPTLPAFA
jgi:hypothetical protein